MGDKKDVDRLFSLTAQQYSAEQRYDNAPTEAAKEGAEQEIFNLQSEIDDTVDRIDTPDEEE